jgi:hypothetical protein
LIEKNNGKNGEFKKIKNKICREGKKGFMGKENNIANLKKKIHGKSFFS